MKRFVLALALVGLVIAPAVVNAQARTTGGVNVSVVQQEDGSAVSGATVTVSSTDLGLEWEGDTNNAGVYRLTGLQVGDYTVAVVAVGFQPQVLSFRLGVGETYPLKVELAPGEAVTQEITVFSAPTALETTHVGGSLDYEKEVEELPINNRTLNTIAFFAPNVASNPNANPSISGAPGTDTVVMLDGAEVSDPYFGSAPTLFLEDAVEEVQVLTSGISARYGRFQGGVINAVTKSGSNQYEATLRSEFRRESWDGQTPAEEARSEDLRKVRQLTGGGFVLKDRVWWFGGVRDVPDSSVSYQTVVTNETQNRVTAEDRWQGKLRAAPSANHIFDISHLEFESSQSNRAALPAGDIKFTNGIRADPRETDTLAYQGVLSPTLFADVQATEKAVSIKSGGDPTGPSPLWTSTPFAFWNNHWWDFSDASLRDNETQSGNISYAFETGDNSHFLEAGIQNVNSITGGENKQTPTNYYMRLLNTDAYAGQSGPDATFNIYAPDDPACPNFSATTGCIGRARRSEAIRLGGDNEIENLAVYVQDTVTFKNGKFRADVGLRYDDVTSTSPLAFQNFAFDEVSPRLAFAWNVDPSLQILVTGGQYLGRLNDNIFGEATGVGSAPGITSFYTGPTMLGFTGAQIDSILSNDAYWQDIRALTDPNQPTTFIVDNVTGPSAQDLSLGFRKAFANNTGSVTVTAHRRKFDDLMEDFIGNVCTDQGLSFDTGGRPGCDTIAAETAPGVFTDFDTTVWGNSDLAQRDYQAITTTWDWRPSRNLVWFGNLTVGKIDGNFEGEGQNTPASGGNLHDYPNSRPEEGAAPVGLLDEDVSQRLRTGATYTHSMGRAGSLAFGAVLTKQSGRVYSATASNTLTAAPGYLQAAGSTYTHYFGGRGIKRLDSWMRGDLSVRYNVKVWNRVGFWTKLSALNVTNESEITDFNGRNENAGSAQVINGVLTFVPSGNCTFDDKPSPDCTGFGRVRSDADYQAPRSVLVTAGFTWR